MVGKVRWHTEIRLLSQAAATFHGSINAALDAAETGIHYNTNPRTKKHNAVADAMAYIYSDHGLAEQVRGDEDLANVIIVDVFMVTQWHSEWGGQSAATDIMVIRI
jgi:hypothetical protein